MKEKTLLSTFKFERPNDGFLLTLLPRIVAVIDTAWMATTPRNGSEQISVSIPRKNTIVMGSGSVDPRQRRLYDHIHLFIVLEKRTTFDER